MTSTRTHTWQDIHERIRSNIRDRTWTPGDLIPGEAALAEQFGCARTTVNRALRELASTGVIDRKRKAGTRVATQQARRVSATIPVIRAQVEEQGFGYRFTLLENRLTVPPEKIRHAMQIKANRKALHIRSVHYADEVPYIYEDRWVNSHTIKEIKKIDLSKISVNEWLVQHVPFTNGEFIIEAGKANKSVANALSLPIDETVLCSNRSTWLDSQSVTRVKLFYSPGYKMRFDI